MSLDNEQMETRLSSVEEAVTQIQAKLGLTPSAPNWVEQISGSLADMPEDEYQQFLDCCRAIRNGEVITSAQEPRP